ncbi:endolytic transglycosylase MltG [Kocuria palustris]|uniref:endolytic transglycosylase MltG n=1 Tax=Kocuria palustris TaxID=71999 RepID=UPI0021A4AB4A|nr:endolytic transglycosylase MltG [Kocuria palustris]MCT1590983.1 endolytic transglycosylase MltG [Kocuria palustris]
MSDQDPRTDAHTEDSAGTSGGPRRESREIAGAFEAENRSPEELRRLTQKHNMSLLGAIALFTVAVVLTVTVLGSTFGWFERHDYRGEGQDPVTFTVQEGATVDQIAVTLEEEDIVADGERFVEVFNEGHAGDFVQPGEYELNRQMSSEAAVSRLMQEEEATDYAAVPRTVRMDETFQILSESTGHSVQDFEDAAEDPTQYGISDEFPTIEGYLHPGEYRFPLDATPEEILQEMVDSTNSALEDAGVAEEDEFEILTVASIVEFEGVPDIYDDVAGAIYNRLDNPDAGTGGLIQSDASVAYGLGETTVHISEEEKEDKSNEYNTYANPGLPVGPIGSPSTEAIDAAANPAENDYYYWVTVNLDTGETKFASTLEEHAGNVDEYQQWCSENEDKCQ